MHIYAAVGAASDVRGVVRNDYPNVLASYGYPTTVRGVLKAWVPPNESSVQKRFILDSGAFQAFTKGQVIDLNGYSEMVIEASEILSARGVIFNYMNLDVIGNHMASHKNWEALKAGGLDPIPVFQYASDLSFVEEMAAESPYVALGGLVPLSPRAQEQWLDRVFSRLPSDTNIHLLGCLRKSLLTKFPVHSADSSQASRYSVLEVKSHRTEFPDLPAKELREILYDRALARMAKTEVEITENWKNRQHIPMPLPLFDF